jgi:hypothetical protein
MRKRFLGIVLAPGLLQDEGVSAVLDRVAATGAQAISTTPGLVRPASRATGRREPPLDIDGYERLLDRPLWGQRELYLENLRAHDWDERLFADTPYRPGGALAPARDDDWGATRELPRQTIAEAHARGLAAHLQLSPTSIAGLRAEDQIRYIDGSLPDPAHRVARQGCLNSAAVRAYILAQVRDTVRHYPECDGLFFDWIEYTVYALEDYWGCACPHCARQAAALGYDWERIVRDVRALWDWAHALDALKLERVQRLARRPWELLELLQSFPGWLDFIRLKSETVTEVYGLIRQAMDAEGAQHMQLGANGWPPPFNRASGVDYRALAQVCHVVRPKLFTFHWSALPRWYGQVLRQWNPDLSERQLLDALVDILELPDDNAPRSFAQYHIPAPHEDHPARPECWREKLDEVVDQVGGRAACYALAHSYRSLAQWKRMIAVVRDSRVDGMWVQRYDYLSDDKLDALARMWG